MSVTSAFRLHDAVLSVSAAARNMPLPKKRIAEDNVLWRELVLCILSSQEKYEAAKAMCFRLESALKSWATPTKNTIRRRELTIHRILAEPIRYEYAGVARTRRIRFHRRKAEHICRTMSEFIVNGTTFDQLVWGHESVQNARADIIKHCHGIGPKQASMFLRNVGWRHNLAVLDKHVLDFMHIMGLAGSGKSISTLNEYQRLESALQHYADSYSVEMYYLDIAIWVTMRTARHVQA